MPKNRPDDRHHPDTAESPQPFTLRIDPETWIKRSALVSELQVYHEEPRSVTKLLDDIMRKLGIDNDLFKDDKGHIWYPRELVPLVKWMYRQRKDNPIFVKLLDESVDSLEEILALERQAIAALNEGGIFDPEAELHMLRNEELNTITENVLPAFYRKVAQLPLGDQVAILTDYRRQIEVLTESVGPPPDESHPFEWAALQLREMTYALVDHQRQLVHLLSALDAVERDQWIERQLPALVQWVKHISDFVHIPDETDANPPMETLALVGKHESPLRAFLRIQGMLIGLFLGLVPSDALDESAAILQTYQRWHHALIEKLKERLKDTLIEELTAGFPEDVRAKIREEQPERD